MASVRRWAAGVLAVLGLVACRKDGVSGGEDPADTVEPPGSSASPLWHAAPLPTSKGALSAIPPPSPEPPLLTGSSAPASFAPIAKHADPSVVTITTGEDLEPSLFGGRPRREVQGLGTGFIVDKDGIILTNNHVIEGAKIIVVKLSNDKLYPGRVVGRDPRTEIAVVKIDEHGLVPIALGDSDALEVGDWVVAIGNPFGLSHTVSAGIISAKGRTEKEVPLDPAGYYNFLQTDASINPGNSGGPLLNLRGEVVGINTAIRGGGAQGIGFAIPINMVKQLLPMLLRDGHVTRSALGIRQLDVHELTPEDRAALKLASEQGAVIEGVEPGGPADRAHLAPGDVIMAFDGTPLVPGSLLRWLASTAGVGKVVTLRVSRYGKLFDADVTLGQLAEPVRMGR
jgi:serine protease Do